MTVNEDRESVVLYNQGQKIFGILHLPKGVKCPPCVLICHGLGGHKTGRYRVYVELAEALIQAGIAVLRFDFRGSGDSEGDFSEMTLSGEVSDALSALEYLKTDGRIDNQRIGVFGRSLGAAVAVLSASSVDFVKCMALWAPLYNGDQWKNQWSHISKGTVTEEESNEMRRINGQVASLKFYGELFSMHISKALEGLKEIPLLIMHGEKDELITIAHSELYAEQRRHAKGQTEFIRLKEGDHDFSFTDERKYAVKITAEWFKERL